MPSLFLPHGGGPMPLLGDPGHAPLISFLKGVKATLPAKPKAIVLATAHWEGRAKVMVSTNSAPDMLFDYYGFPPETYKYKYPAPGSPELAARVLGLLEHAGIASEGDAKRGFDHGTFVPLMLAFPDADIPVVQMSLVDSLDPSLHLSIGKALAPLRDEGVLVVGSGMSYHNMSYWRSAGFGNLNAPVDKHGEEFDQWLTSAATGLSGEARAKQLARWSDAPSGRQCHPREEHLLPLMVAAGAGSDSPGRANYSGLMVGARVSGYIFG